MRNNNVQGKCVDKYPHEARKDKQLRKRSHDDAAVRRCIESDNETELCKRGCQQDVDGEEAAVVVLRDVCWKRMKESVGCRERR